MTLVQRLRDLKTRVLCVRITSLLALLLCFLLAYNCLYIFYLNLPLFAKFPPHPPNSTSSSSYASSHPHSSPKRLASSPPLMYVIREENSTQLLKPNLAALHVNQSSPELKPVPETETKKKPVRQKKRLSREELLGLSSDERFAPRIEEFFGPAGNNCAEPRFFMTWISSLDSFGDRESFAVQSLFRAHPRSCLAVVSKTMDSAEGREILRPFAEAGFRVAAVSPDYDFIFAKTPAEDWLHRLRRGHVDPGKIPLGQNLSNLLRLCLLYKYGGVYTDTDVFFVKSFSGLRNAVGAQASDPETGQWRLLNNAVLVFDKAHPLVLEFIAEFARTFNGYRWGYNGPYMLSRVVKRLGLGPGPGFGLSVLPPSAFYPVLWTEIQELFRESEEKWRVERMRQILEESYAVHLWNKESKMLRANSGSVIDCMRREFCVLCNKTMLVLSRPTSSKFVN